MGGFTVGFDSDPHDIFEQQFQFIQRSGVVTAMVGLLTALPKTRLYERLLKEGRSRSGELRQQHRGRPQLHAKLDREFLESGYRALMTRLYEPTFYYRGSARSWRNTVPQPASGSLAPRPADRSAVDLAVWESGRRDASPTGGCSDRRCCGVHGNSVRRRAGIFGHHFRRVAARAVARWPQEAPTHAHAWP